MALTFEDVLSVVCSEVTAANANDHQRIYMLRSDSDAKLAFDVLIAFGFNARVYHTPSKPSKLYISNPKMPAQQIEEQLSAALVYARSLKSIKNDLDDLCKSATDLVIRPSGYTISFVNSQPNGKQISIQLHHSSGEIPAVIGDNPATEAPSTETATAPAAAMAAAATPAPAAVSAPVQKKPVVTAASKRMAKMKKKQEEGIGAGPAVGRGLYPSSKMTDSTKKKSFHEKVMLRLFGNMATSGYATVMWLVIAGLIFSCFVGAKSFLCYDFVAVKSKKWYCQDQTQPSAEDLRRQEEAKRRKAVGLGDAPQ